MAAKALDYDHADGVNAAFMRNHRGEVCIAFSDPVYVRADAVLADRDNLSVHIIIHENAFFIGHVSEAMMNAFESNSEALLTAIRTDGSLLELTAPIQSGRKL